ncbi:MAG: hypothetical protein RR065_06975 [Clostridia bacterium]
MGIKLPKLKPIRTSTGGVVAFAGLNRNLRRKDNEFAQMQNITSNNLPVAAVRDRRRYMRTLEKPNGLFAHDELCWVDGADFYYGGKLAGQVTDSLKTFVRMGARVLIWPDQMMYNSQSGKMEALEAHYSSTGEVCCTLCRADGTSYGEYTIGDTAPQKPVNGQYWMDTSADADVLRQYAQSAAMWASVPTVYTMIACAGIGKDFAQYDGVSISGLTDAKLNGDFFIVSRTDDQLVVTALIQAAFTQMQAVRVERKTPDMDYLCESNNRIWGCAANGHEVYACALGDPKNWRQYMGLSTDSYAATVGSSGAFTGVAAHLGSVYFFKSDCVHQIMGTKPANYAVNAMETRGVGAGNSKSLLVIEERLYFKGENEVCAFGASMPGTISDALPRMGGHAVGGALASRYYLCVDDAYMSRELLVYDTRNGVWVREDEVDIMSFATLDGRLYALRSNGDLLCMVQGENPYDGAGAEDEKAVEWALETGDLGLDEACSKYISGIQLHGDVDLGASFCVAIRYDGGGAWNEVFRSSPVTQRSWVLPIVPRRCRTLRLRLHGVGGMRLYSMVMRTEAGSDVYAIK